MNRISWLVASAAMVSTGLAVHAGVNCLLLRRPVTDPIEVDGTDRISVLLPARNEAGSIGPCLAALLELRGVTEVIVLDDASTDDTAAQAEAIITSHPSAVAARSQVVRGDPEAALPDGWLGKNWACHRLAELASGTVLIFIDADVVVADNAAVATVELMRTRHLDLVSPYPRQLADGLVPRLIQPLLQWSWLTFVPLRISERSDRGSLAVANGQFLAIDALRYHDLGGHRAVAGQVIEDVELARAVRAAGGRTAVVDGTDLATCRMYSSTSELVEGYSKSLWAAFGGPAGTVGTATVLLFAYLVPPAALLFSRNRVVRSWGLLGYGSGVAGRFVVARRTGQRTFPDVLAQPLSVLGLVSLIGNSILRKRRGTLTWKGRQLQ